MLRGDIKRYPYVYIYIYLSTICISNISQEITAGAKYASVGKDLGASMAWRAGGRWNGGGLRLELGLA